MKKVLAYFITVIMIFSSFSFVPAEEGEYTVKITDASGNVIAEKTIK